MERGANINEGISAQTPKSANVTEKYTPSLGSRLRSGLYLCLAYWPWFVVSVAVFVGLTALYLLRTPKSYEASASILVTTDKSSKQADKAFIDMVLLKSTDNIDNEISSLNTTDVAIEIVNRLALNVSYAHEGRLHEEVAYGTLLPVAVKFPDIDENATVTLKLNLRSNGDVYLSNFTNNGEPVAGSTVKMRLGTTAETPIGKVTVEKSPFYKERAFDQLTIRRIPIMAAATRVSGGITAQLRSKNSTIIDVRYRDISIQRAKDILATLVDVYNENWAAERDRISNITSDFIRNRLGVIEDELGNVDHDISQYKSVNLLPDIKAAGNMAMTEARENSAQVRQLSGRIGVATALRNAMTNADNATVTLNSDINNQVLAQQVANYNDLLLKRQKHLSVTSENNPIVVDIDRNLASLRNAITSSLNSEIEMLQAQRMAAMSGQSSATAQIAVNPMQEKYLLTVERQQKVKESLYLYLLQKREENELQQAFTANETKLIERPHQTSAPATPNSATYYAMALILGLCLPAGVVFAKDILNASVRSRSDLKLMKTPFIGEIPQAPGTKPLTPASLRKQAAGKHRRERPLLICENEKDYINEAFRVVRSNLEFVTGFNSPHKLLLLTSMNPSSGKTFITLNLAETIGLSHNKRVIAVDLDLRKAALSKSLGNADKGLANYLSGEIDDYHKLILNTGHIDYLPVGPIPPNPTELLIRPELGRMLEELGRDYDYVLIDCSPVEIVADVQIISRHTDVTIFVIRAGIFDRSFLADIDYWYETKKYPNLTVLLNGTDRMYGGYGNYRYGYRYGYGYGYGSKEAQ